MPCAIIKGAALAESGTYKPRYGVGWHVRQGTTWGERSEDPPAWHLKHMGRLYGQQLQDAPASRGPIGRFDWGIASVPYCLGISNGKRGL